MPIFSFWTFGPCQGQDSIGISYQLTWINASISTMAWCVTLVFEGIPPNYYFILFIMINIDMIVLYYIQYNVETRNDNEAIYITVLNVNTMKEEEEHTQDHINGGAAGCPTTVWSRFLFYIVLIYDIFLLFGMNGTLSSDYLSPFRLFSQSHLPEI